MQRKVSQNELVEFDAWAFCRTGGTIEGFAGTLAFPRIDSSSDIGSFELKECRIQGSLNRQGECVLHFEGQFVADLMCVACSHPVEQNLTFSRRLVLTKSEQQADQKEQDCEQDDIDFVVCEGLVNLNDWLEDELLLAMPMFPRHIECESNEEDVAHRSVASDEQRESLQKEVHKPFADLGSLLGRDKK